MFTGIVEELGIIEAIKRGTHSAAMRIGAKEILADIKIGDSIAVNGICLTVTSFDQSGFWVDVMHETLQRSSIGAAGVKSKVNLERAMLCGGRFGGHIVSGHIDGTGTIVAIQKDDNAIWYTIRANASVMCYVVEKGSVAIDGISLTVASVSEEEFKVSIIPHTQANTTLFLRKVGDTVNLENDCIGKYVEKLLGIEEMQNVVKSYSKSAWTTKNRKLSEADGSITKDFLLTNGF